MKKSVTNKYLFSSFPEKVVSKIRFRAKNNRISGDFRILCIILNHITLKFPFNVNPQFSSIISRKRRNARRSVYGLAHSLASASRIRSHVPGICRPRSYAAVRNNARKRAIFSCCTAHRRGAEEEQAPRFRPSVTRDERRGR